MLLETNRATDRRTLAAIRISFASPMLLTALFHGLLFAAVAFVAIGCGPRPDESHSLSGALSSGGDGQFATSLEQLKIAHEQEQQRLNALRASNAELQRAQKEERGRLDALRAATEEARRDAEVAREEASFQECKAAISEITAITMNSVMICSKSDADYQSCRASRSNNTAVGTGVGCGLGILLGLATAGASLAMCALGAGAGHVMSGACGDQPVCATNEALLASAMASRGLTERPMCGGALEVTAHASEQHVAGWGVYEIVPNSAASDMGILPGDFVVRVGDMITDGSGEIGDGVEAIAPGQQLVVEIVRDRIRHRLTATLRAEKLLGAKANPSATDEIVVVVERVPQESALRTGDILVGINGQDTFTLERLRDATRLLRAGTRVIVEVQRGAIREGIDIELVKRTSSEEL